MSRSLWPVIQLVSSRNDGGNNNNSSSSSSSISDRAGISYLGLPATLFTTMCCQFPAVLCFPAVPATVGQSKRALEQSSEAAVSTEATRGRKAASCVPFPFLKVALPTGGPASFLHNPQSRGLPKTGREPSGEPPESFPTSEVARGSQGAPIVLITKCTGGPTAELSLQSCL